jgi:hypothetical protein
VSEIKKFARGEGFGEEISPLVSPKDVNHLKLLGKNFLSDKEQINLHVLGTGMKDRVVG